MNKLCIAALVLGLWALPLWGEVWFSDLDLSPTGELLFRAEADCPGFGTYHTLFAAELASGRLRQLTIFPERASLLAESGVLEIQNRYGLFRSDSELKNLQLLTAVPSFIGRGQVESGKLDLAASSPDGRYLLILRPKTAAFGELVLVDLEGAQESLVSGEIELSLKLLPALWSTESDFFIYGKQGNLYYFSIRQLRENRVLAEPYRLIGEGTIRNVRWGASGSLYYLAGSVVFQIDARELFTRSLYAGYLSIGRNAGTIPFDFDPNFDEYWIAADGEHVLLSKGGRNLFLYPLTTEDFSSGSQARSLPYLYLARSGSVKRVLWTKAGTIILLVEGRHKGKSRTDVYRLSVSGSASAPAFRRTEDEGILDLVLSPDEQSVAAIQNEGVSLYSAESWTRKATRPHPRPLHALWSPDGELLIAGAHFTELWNPSSGSHRLIALSQPGKASFAADEQSALTEVEGTLYQRPLSAEAWTKAAAASLREKKTSSDAYRVYLEDSPNLLLRNRIMVRDVRSYVTRTLTASPAIRYEPYPLQEEPADFNLFAHGSRIRRREIALVFDVVNAIEGLPGILETLNEYKIRATFFVNGEAIRRHPDAVREIAEAGHEMGSLFTMNFNMTDSRFQLDRDFIKHGLARTEDEYHAATGGELALLWHAPYYFASSEAVAASKEMNYTYVSRDLDSLDWVTMDPGKAAPDIYFPSARLVERIVAQKKPGSIVPILAGKPAGAREDYLFQKLDLLIDALLRLGYTTVPVSTLMEHAK